MNKYTALAIMGMGFLGAGLYLASIDWEGTAVVCMAMSVVCLMTITEGA